IWWLVGDCGHSKRHRGDINPKHKAGVRHARGGLFSTEDDDSGFALNVFAETPANQPDHEGKVLRRRIPCARGSSHYSRFLSSSFFFVFSWNVTLQRVPQTSLPPVKSSSRRTLRTAGSNSPADFVQE